MIEKLVPSITLSLQKDGRWYLIFEKISQYAMIAFDLKKGLPTDEKRWDNISKDLLKHAFNKWN